MSERFYDVKGKELYRRGYRPATPVRYNTKAKAQKIANEKTNYTRRPAVSHAFNFEVVKQGTKYRVLYKRGEYLY
jgi:hypothetical protein